MKIQHRAFSGEGNSFASSLRALHSVVDSARPSCQGSRASFLPSEQLPADPCRKIWISRATLLRQRSRISHIFCVGDHTLDYFENINRWLWTETINSCRKEKTVKKIPYYRQTSCQNNAGLWVNQVWSLPLWWGFFWFWASGWLSPWLYQRWAEKHLWG